MEHLKTEANSQIWSFYCELSCLPPQWGAANTEIKAPYFENTELKSSSFKAWSRSVSYIAIHAMLTTRDLFLANFYPSGPFTCIFPKPLRSFFCVGCG